MLNSGNICTTNLLTRYRLLEYFGFMNHIMLSFLMLSSLSNVILAWFLFGRKKQKPLTTDAAQILSDILKGGTLVHIVRVAPEDVFLRSPRR
jgi:hypothetical protein